MKAVMLLGFIVFATVSSEIIASTLLRSVDVVPPSDSCTNYRDNTTYINIGQPCTGTSGSYCLNGLNCVTTNGGSGYTCQLA